MSAEKEIINFWYNNKGFFTINNIKTNNNKDAGMLALRQNDDSLLEIYHVGVMCSITNNISESVDLGNPLRRIAEEKFGDESVLETVRMHANQFLTQDHKIKIKKVLVLGAMPKSGKNSIIAELSRHDVQVLQFEDILCDIYQQIDTHYYKNDVIRTIQLTKFLLLGEPEKLSRLLVNGALNTNARKEFVSSMLDKEDIIKEFKKTSAERLGAILKSSGIKAHQLAEIIENKILNKKTRKKFFDSLIKQEKIRKIETKSDKSRKANIPLNKFIK